MAVEARALGQLGYRDNLCAGNVTSATYQTVNGQLSWYLNGPVLQLVYAFTCADGDSWTETVVRNVSEQWDISMAKPKPASGWEPAVPAPTVSYDNATNTIAMKGPTHLSNAIISWYKPDPFIRNIPFDYVRRKGNSRTAARNIQLWKVEGDGQTALNALAKYRPGDISVTQIFPKIRPAFPADGLTDIAIVGMAGLNAIPVAISRGDGSFAYRRDYLADFPAWATHAGARVSAMDVNFDSRADMVMTGGKDWTTMPVAVSKGNGTFTVLNPAVASFPGWSRTPGVKIPFQSIDAGR